MKPAKTAYKMLKYGISSDDQILLPHVVALILYCDFSAYCTEFSSTFRKLSTTEPMNSVKKRNSSFWFQSKYLREVIECYGTCNYEEVLQSGTVSESGPFYTGIDIVLAIPQFALRLCSPTSTSKHVEVSLNFAKRSGLIIELSNPEQDHRAARVCFLDVSWLSRFPDEDERVFAGLCAFSQVLLI